MRILMKHIVLTSALMMAAGQATWAHDPAEHAKEAAEAKAPANCANMHKMHTSTMKADDPVMQAMMSKCKAQASRANTNQSVPPVMNHSQMQSMPKGMDHSKMSMPAGK